jgi:hypothetical protein
LPWAAVTLFDPLLVPMRRTFFGQTVRQAACFVGPCVAERLHGCSAALRLDVAELQRPGNWLPARLLPGGVPSHVRSTCLPACLQEPGDLDYAAVALLALICSLLECLVGKEGLLNDFIPDFALLAALQVRRGAGEFGWLGMGLGAAQAAKHCCLPLQSRPA